METAIRTFGGRMNAAVRDERGLEAVEYVAMIVVALALLLAVKFVFDGDTSVGDAILRKLVEFISGL